MKLLLSLTSAHLIVASQFIGAEASLRGGRSLEVFAESFASASQTEDDHEQSDRMEQRIIGGSQVGLLITQLHFHNLFGQ